MKSVECDRVKSNLYPTDSALIEALRSELEGFVKLQTKRFLDDIVARMEKELAEVAERPR